MGSPHLAQQCGAIKTRQAETMQSNGENHDCSVTLKFVFTTLKTHKKKNLGPFMVTGVN